MLSLQTTLLTIVKILQEFRIPYMVIGGLANAVWGQPRATLDVDIILWLGAAKISRWLTVLSARHFILPDHPEAFIKQNRVLPLRLAQGGQIDLIFGSLPYEKAAIQRAKTIKLTGVEVHFCAPEDLIILKIISERKKDQEDVAQLIFRQRKKLDFKYLEPRLQTLAEKLGKPEIWEKWQAKKA